FALSLRNGPPGAGSYVFPTDVNRIIEQGVACGLVVTLELREQPSLMKHKENVVWSRLVFEKQIAKYPTR
ncbi:MAG: hypothetical protein AAF694_30955, partial [Bacteroidota bacterium]